MVGIFLNAAVVRLVGALMPETNDEWAVSRRYMTLETLGVVSDNPLIRLPVLAAWTRYLGSAEIGVPTPPPGTGPAHANPAKFQPQSPHENPLLGRAPGACYPQARIAFPPKTERMSGQMCRTLAIPALSM